MAKKEISKEGWQEFRNEILELVILYHHVKEYADFDKEKIKYFESFFHLSRKQAITSFFIKVGFLISNGSPTLKDFLLADDYSGLLNLYKPKVKQVRDFWHSHNLKSKLPLNFTISNGDIEVVYSKIISLAQEIDKKYNDSYNYEMVSNAGGIKSIEHLIERSIELNDLKKSLLEQNFKAKVELEIMSGKINILGAL